MEVKLICSTQSRSAPWFPSVTRKGSHKALHHSRLCYCSRNKAMILVVFPPSPATVSITLWAYKGVCSNTKVVAGSFPACVYPKAFHNHSCSVRSLFDKLPQHFNYDSLSLLNTASCLCVRSRRCTRHAGIKECH